MKNQTCLNLKLPSFGENLIEQTNQLKMANNYQWLKIQNNIFSLHPLTIILMIFFLLIIIYKFLLITPKSKKHLPPCPTKLPIIGNFHQIDKRLPHRSLHNLAKKHGKIMLLQFGIKKVLIISSSEGAYEIMKTHDLIFANRPALSMFKKLIYDCKDVATAPYGDYWRRMRSICVNQLLNNSRVQAFHIVREEEISHMNKQIKNSKLVNLSNLLSNFSTDVICRAAFGMKFNGKIDGINFKDLHEKHEELVGSFNVADFVPWLGWINYVNGVEKEVKRVKRDMNRILEGLIEEHLDGFRKNEGIIKGDNDSNYENTRDFVDVLLDLQKDNSDYAAENSLTRESIKAIIMVCNSSALKYPLHSLLLFNILVYFILSSFSKLFLFLILGYLFVILIKKFSIYITNFGQN